MSNIIHASFQDGRYHVYNAYNIKDDLKRMGAVFDGEEKSWVLNASFKDDLVRMGIQLLIRAKTDSFCHEESRTVYLSEEELKDRCLRMYCTKCDKFIDGVKFTEF